MFELQRMGWHAFQRLCITICREVLGQTVESFLDTNDAGMDGAFTGTWTPTLGQQLSGRFIIQCKFSARYDHRLTLSELAADIRKAGALAKAGMCDIYVLMTNAGMSGQTRVALEKRLHAVGIKQVLVLQANWIEEQIRTHRRLRMLVPQMYGLGDLTQILDARAYAQARAILDSMREDLRKVVVTTAYHRAAEAIDKHRFVLLIGEPAAGKTTIASMLAMASADQWDASVIKLHDPAVIPDHWNPQEPSQFFWIDDAFGVTQYESDLVRGWNRVLPQIQAALRGGARIVMTSRDYIYNRARRDLKSGAFPLLDEAQVVIDVRDLSEDERCQILYNHMKQGNQPKEFKTRIKGLLEGVANQPRFIPEVARRLADPAFTKKLVVSNHSLAQFVDRREQILVELCGSLDDDCKAALALIYMRNGRLESPIHLTPSEGLALSRMNSDLGKVSVALESLSGSLVQHVVSDDAIGYWVFKHPTIGDALSELLRRNPELLGVFVAGSSVDQLVQQVTCGEVGIERAVSLPATLFDQVIDKLIQHETSAAYKSEWLSRWVAKRMLHTFLSTRCSKAFLERYLARYPDTLKRIVDPGLYLAWSPDVELCIRLFELGLLQEEARKTFVENICQYAVTGQDALVLQDRRLKAILSSEELHQLQQDLLKELIPNLGDVREHRELEFDDNDDADGHMQPFRDLIDALRVEFPDDRSVQAAVDEESKNCEAWVVDHGHEANAIEPREIAVKDIAPGIVSKRGIFDDVDE